MVVGNIDRYGMKSQDSSYGPELDVMAPGTDVWSTYPIHNYKSMPGTSMAAPHVAGIAALLLNAQPYLSSEHVRDIIERTAQKSVWCNDGCSYLHFQPYRYNGTYNTRIGYGLVDAKAAVSVAAAANCTDIDLFMADTPNDYGVEPGTATKHANYVLWNSPDIWNRNIPDGLVNHEHQNPVYGSTAYINVRIKNKSCFDYTGGVMPS